jgi:hypothetical protein
LVAGGVAQLLGVGGLLALHVIVELIEDAQPVAAVAQQGLGLVPGAGGGGRRQPGDGLVVQRPPREQQLHIQLGIEDLIGAV